MRWKRAGRTPQAPHKSSVVDKENVPNLSSLLCSINDKQPAWLHATPTACTGKAPKSALSERLQNPTPGTVHEEILRDQCDHVVPTLSAAKVGTGSQIPLPRAARLLARKERKTPWEVGKAHPVSMLPVVVKLELAWDRETPETPMRWLSLLYKDSVSNDNGPGSSKKDSVSKSNGLGSGLSLAPPAPTIPATDVRRPAFDLSEVYSSAACEGSVSDI